jgi:hypothetical protein
MYEVIADLPLEIDDYGYERYEADTSSDFTRVSTVVSLSGAGETGRGEDVTYDTEDHDRLHADPPDLPTGTYTFDEYSEGLAETALFPVEPERHTSYDYRRWAVESAALELALRQADTTLGAVLDRTYDPVRFVVSTRLGDPPTPEKVRQWLDIDPGIEFKLDPTREWTADLAETVAATDSVRVLDFKAYYENETVAQEPDPDLYRTVAAAFPDAVLEDARWTDETEPILAEHADRLSWDKPITGVDSVEALPVEPRWLNVKPSRFGSVESLLDTIAYAEARDITLYGGGQFELDVGRGHVQALAALFYPDAPNDVAPREYNAPEPRPGLPASPLAPPDEPAGIGW